MKINGRLQDSLGSNGRNKLKNETIEKYSDSFKGSEIILVKNFS